MKESGILQIWEGKRYFTDDTLSITVVRVEKPRTSHKCTVGRESFQGPYTGYGFKFGSERRDALVLRACRQHQSELEHVMSTIQEQLLDALRGNSDPYGIILDVLSEKTDLHF